MDAEGRISVLAGRRCELMFFFFSSRRRHTRLQGDWSSDVCSSDLLLFDAERHRVRQVFFEELGRSDHSLVAVALHPREKFLEAERGFARPLTFDGAGGHDLREQYQHPPANHGGDRERGGMKKDESKLHGKNRDDAYPEPCHGGQSRPLCFYLVRALVVVVCLDETVVDGVANLPQKSIKIGGQLVHFFG